MGSGRRVPGTREREFLPALVEIEESPPSPVGRAVALTLMALLAGAVGWAVIGQVDVVAVARGRIVPTGHSKVVQPFESGIVRAIHVRDGQTVRRGAVLIELDPTTKAADHERLLHEARTALVHAARLRALLDGEPALTAAPDAPAALVALQQRLLEDQQAEHTARLEGARLTVVQRQAAVAAVRADIARLEAIVPIITERADAFRRLLAGEYVARLQYLEVEQERITRVQELAAQRERLAQSLAALAEAEAQSDVIEVEFARSRVTELAEWEARAASLAQEVIKAARTERIQRLTAPADGVVQQLAVHTVGGVVTPAQPLLVVVPADARLEGEVWVENKDIGFVKAGQEARVKVDAFPFTRYGTVDGAILTVSRDAVPLERGGLVYAARVSLGRVVVEADEGPVPLRPGMSVSVEIKTGQRRLIEFVLSPLLRAGSEAARER